SDDGVGIPPDAMRRPKSHGLLGMRERALLLGGSLKVERGVNGVGTCVQAWVPLESPGAEPVWTAAGGPPALPVPGMDLAGVASAAAPVALRGGTASIMRVQHPAADGRTRF
ncbi:MAG: histidine kinase, partial [Telluria sp.]